MLNPQNVALLCSNGQGVEKERIITTSFRHLFLLAILVLLSFVLALAQEGELATQLMRRASSAQKRGELSTAIQLYQRVVALRPHWAPAEYNLGLAILVEKHYAAAVKLFDRALSDDPTLADAYLFRGIAYYNLGLFRQAVSSLKRCSELRPQDPQVRYYLAGSYFALKDYPDAALQYALQIDRTWQRQEAYYYLGHCYLAMASEAVKNLSREPEGKYYTWLILGEREAEEGNMATALQDIRKAMRLNPLLPEAFIDLGDLFLETGQYVKAQAAFEQALRSNQLDCSGLQGLGDTELAMGSPLKALRYYRKALRFPCELRHVPPNLGFRLNEFSQRVNSLALYKASPPWRQAVQVAIARLIPENHDTHGREAKAGSTHTAGEPNQLDCRALIPEGSLYTGREADLFLASCRELKGDIQGATSALVAIERHRPIGEKAAYQIVDIEMRLSQRVLSMLERVFPNSYLLAEMRGEWFELRGKYHEADSEYKKAAMMSGRDPSPLIEYARFKCKLNQLDEAQPILEKALKLAPYNADVNSLLGYIYFSRNEFEVAIPYLRLAIKERPTDEQSRIYLAESLAHLHLVVKAVGVLESAPSDPDGRIHYVLAGYYRQLGHKQQMKDALALFGERQRQLHAKVSAR